MNISPVSFAGYAEKVNAPQKYSRSGAVSKPGKKGKKSVGKTALKTILGAGVIAAGLGVAAKKGKLAPKEGGNKIINAIKKPLNSIGTFVANIASTVKSKLPGAAHKVAEEAAPVVDAVV